VVTSTEAVLLPNERNRLPIRGTRDSYAHSSTDSPANTPTNPTTDAAAPAATAPDTAAAACRPSRPFQLCRGHTEHVEGGQEVMVLQGPPRWMPSANRPAANANASTSADAGSSSCRPIQLC